MKQIKNLSLEMKNSNLQATLSPEVMEKFENKQKLSLLPMFRMTEWLGAHYEFRHNIVTGVYECRSTDDQDAKFIIVDKNIINTIGIELAIAGISVKTSVIEQLIISTAAEDYHPTRSYLNKVRETWDGVDRIDSFLSRINSSDYCRRLGHIWLRAMVAQMMGKNKKYANSVMMILVSPTQGLGKSTFMRSLLPDELQDYYTDDFSLNQKALGLRKTVEYALINDDEMDKESPKKDAFMKTLLQCLKPSFRGAYKKHINQLPRIASFVGTSNKLELLSDPTGSRRFLILEPEGIINVEGINHDQIYAQLLDEIEKGEPIYFNKEEEKEMQAHNKSYYRHTELEEFILRYYRKPMEGETPAELSCSMMMQALSAKNKKIIRETTARTFSIALTRLFGESKHTSLGNFYYLIEK